MLQKSPLYQKPTTGFRMCKNGFLETCKTGFRLNRKPVLQNQKLRFWMPQSLTKEIKPLFV